MCYNACITWLSESTNTEREKSHWKTNICPPFIKRTFVRVSSKVYLSVFGRTNICPPFIKSTFVRVSSKVYLSVFGRTNVCPRMIDRTFVRVVPYICPSFIKHTSVRILSNEVRFTKQVCPDPCQIGRRKQFGQNTPEFGSQRPLGGKVFGLTRCEVKVQSATISLHNPSTPHTTSAEQNRIPREYYECLLFSYQSTILSERILRSFVPRDYQLTILSCFAVKVLWCGWTKRCASFGLCHVTLLWHNNMTFLCLICRRADGAVVTGCGLRNRWANECKQPESKCLFVVTVVLCNAICSCCV